MVSVDINELCPWSTNAATNNVQMNELYANKTLFQKQIELGENKASRCPGGR